MKQTKVLAHLAGGGEQGVALKPRILYNCHNYDHDVNYSSVRGKTEAKGALVPFSKSASFNQTMNFPTSRKFHQQVKVSPRAANTSASPRDANSNDPPHKTNRQYQKYAQSFQESF